MEEVVWGASLLRLHALPPMSFFDALFAYSPSQVKYMHNDSSKDK